MKTRALLILILAGMAVFASPLAAQTAEYELAESYESFFRSRILSKGVTGAAFVVVTPEQIIRVGTTGYTDNKRQQRIDENTAFRVASVSKTFAAGLAGLLVSEGAFAWQDRLVDYVPTFQVKGDAGQVRIEHVLGQSTGLIPHAYDNLIEDGLSMDRITDQFRKLSYICQPGRCYSYQNSVFSLIEPVIEKTTARSYSQLMEEKIFRPLDMKTASVGYDAFVNNPNHARPHVKVRGGWATVSVKPNYYNVAPAAGVNASALDMGKWLMAQMGAFPEAFPPSVVATLTQPRVKTARDKRRKYWRDMLSDASYGLGWRIYEMDEHEIVYHSGWVSGFRADLAWSEQYGIGIAVLMNAESNSINELTTTFWQMAFDTLPAAPNSDMVATASVASP